MKLLLFLEAKNYSFDNYLLFIPSYILIVLIRSYVSTKIKWLIDKRYISISKMLFIYGLFVFFISLVIFILTSIIPGYVGEKFGNIFPQFYLINW